MSKWNRTNFYFYTYIYFTVWKSWRNLKKSPKGNICRFYQENLIAEKEVRMLC